MDILLAADCFCCWSSNNIDIYIRHLNTPRNYMAPICVIILVIYTRLSLEDRGVVTATYDSLNKGGKRKCALDIGSKLLLRTF